MWLQWVLDTWHAHGCLQQLLCLAITTHCHHQLCLCGSVGCSLSHSKASCHSLIQTLLGSLQLALLTTHSTLWIQQLLPQLLPLTWRWSQCITSSVQRLRFSPKKKAVSIRKSPYSGLPSQSECSGCCPNSLSLQQDCPHDESACSIKSPQPDFSCLRADAIMCRPKT